MRSRVIAKIIACVGALLLSSQLGSAQFGQQGHKLVGSGVAVGPSEQGNSVAVSADGNTAIVGGPYDGVGNSSVGAAWVFTRSNGVWTQQGSKLVWNRRGRIRPSRHFRCAFQRRQHRHRGRALRRGRQL